MSVNLQQFRTELDEEWRDILSFWRTCMQDVGKGGFYGKLLPKNEVVQGAPKGVVLNARILSMKNLAESIGRWITREKCLILRSKYMDSVFVFMPCRNIPKPQKARRRWRLRSPCLPCSKRKHSTRKRTATLKPLREIGNPRMT